MRIYTAQPEPMAESLAGSLTLGPMGRQGGGDTFSLIIFLILELSAYSKRVSLPLQCQVTHSREIYC